MVLCPNCGEENPDRFRLCGFCGTSLASAPAPEVRKTVTILFSDLRGSTAMAERLDSEAVREVMSRYFDEMRSALEQHGGTIEKYIGDAIMAVFGLPRAQEDDALRAVRAAIEMRERLASLNDELEQRWGVTIGNRTGINTGEVVASDSGTRQRLVTGDTVNTAARLEQAAPADEVLLGETTYRLVRHAVDAEPVEPLELKGKAERAAAYRLLTVRQTESVERHHERELVGRTHELETLLGELGQSIRDRTCRLATILAEAGAGKSRLIEELMRRAYPRARVLQGRCLPYGRGITFWPLVEIMRDAAGLKEDDPHDAARVKVEQVVGPVAGDVSARLTSAIGLSEATFPLEEIFWATRKFFETEAERQPLVVTFEDIHWAEPALLDLIEYLAATVSGVPLLVLCAARPDLLDHRPDWAERPGAVIELAPLSREESTKVIDNVIGHAPLPVSVRDRVVAVAEGNPLFVEQLLSMLIDDGALRREGGGWVAAGDLSELAIPGTIQALLAARLDLLSSEERVVIESASVIGLFFARAAVEHLADLGSAAAEQHLRSMSSKQLVRPDMSQVEADYRFHHLLVRDAAYLGILKRARASMHERFADWAERVNRERDREVEFEEILGYHLEQAYGYLSELGPLDDNGIELGRRAARNLTSAGNRAFARGDMAAAANLLRRARQLLAEGDPDRLQLLPDLAEAMTEIGEFAWAEVFVEEAATGAQEAADAALAAHATLGRLLVGRFHEDEAWGDAVVPQAEGAIQVFGAIEDHAGLAKAYRLLCLAHGTACRFADFLSAGERDLYHAKLAGDRRAQTRAVTAKAIAAVYGPETVAVAIGHCEEALDLAAPNKRSEGIVLALLAELEALRGNVERGRMLYRRARSTLEDAGAGVHAHSMSSHSGPVELLAGDATAAEEELRRDFDTLTAMGETYFASSIAALLAEALYIQARYDEAEGFTRKSEELAPADDLWTQAVWRSVRAKALARDVGRLPEARRLARDAVDLLNPTDAPLWRADGLRDCAEVLSLAGEHDEARALLTDALALYDQKGASVPAERARAQIAAWRDAAER